MAYEQPRQFRPWVGLKPLFWLRNMYGGCIYIRTHRCLCRPSKAFGKLIVTSGIAGKLEVKLRLGANESLDIPAGKAINYLTLLLKLYL